MTEYQVISWKTGTWDLFLTKSQGFKTPHLKYGT